MIKLEIQLALCYASSASDYSAGQINCAYIGFNNRHMTENAAERIHDVGRIKISGCDFVQHRREQNEVLATDQCHLYVRSPSESFVEVYRRVKPGEPTTSNDYSGRFHAITTDRNASRAIKILLMATMLQSFSDFFSSFSASKFRRVFAFLAVSSCKECEMKRANLDHTGDLMGTYRSALWYLSGICRSLISTSKNSSRISRAQWRTTPATGQRRRNHSQFFTASSNNRARY